MCAHVGAFPITALHRHRHLTRVAVHNLAAVPVCASADVRLGSRLIKLFGVGVELAVVALPLACVPRTEEAGVLCAFVTGGLVLLQLRLVGSGKAAVECALPLGFKRREHTQVDEGGVDFGCCPLVLLAGYEGGLSAARPM